MDRTPCKPRTASAYGRAVKKTLGRLRTAPAYEIYKHGEHVEVSCHRTAHCWLSAILFRHRRAGCGRVSDT